VQKIAVWSRHEDQARSISPQATGGSTVWHAHGLHGSNFRLVTRLSDLCWNQPRHGLARLDGGDPLALLLSLPGRESFPSCDVQCSHRAWSWPTLLTQSRANDQSIPDERPGSCARRYVNCCSNIAAARMLLIMDE